MPKSSSSSEDSGPEDRNPPSKQKGKKRPADDNSDDEPKASKDKKQKGPSKDTEGFQRIKNNDGEEMIEIGKLRFVCVREFHGKQLIDLREYYNDKSGKMMPGKKGISLSREQYENFKKLIPEIDSKIKG
uniref:Transcriptional coactivator p15 (PC4) C-terminal domain-containing protein n=1 Tax=Plectus sambesii TaxID=2011161 RepID=A0A914VHS1_9BILA